MTIYSMSWACLDVYYFLNPKQTGKYFACHILKVGSVDISATATVAV